MGRAERLGGRKNRVQPLTEGYTLTPAGGGATKIKHSFRIFDLAAWGLALLGWLSTAAAQEYAFTNFAGMPGVAGSADGTGSAARFDNPVGVAVDGTGNLYVVDVADSTIRKVTPAGAVTTLAGLARSRGSADGTGSVARFSFPQGVAVDSRGYVYVADTTNNTIRQVTPAGAVTTLAGLAGQPGSADGTGAAARFGNPTGIAVDGAGNVYVADTGNVTIRKVTPGGVVSTLAGLAGYFGTADGTGSAARFLRPWGVAVDSLGNVYVADTDNCTVRKITPAGAVTTLAGLAESPGSADGLGSGARFRYPEGVAVDTAGNVYVADTANFTVRLITPAGVVTTLGGLAGNYGSADGTGSVARFRFPAGVAVDGAGNLYVADSGNSHISKGVPVGVSGPPQILVQPQSQSVFSGTNAIISVAANGSPPLSYQWWLNSTNLTQLRFPAPPSSAGAMWGCAFLLVGCYEEGTFRCYLQFTLTRSLNFWWALAAVAAICAWPTVTGKGDGIWGVFVIALLGLAPCLWLYLKRAPGNGFWQAAWVTSTLFGLFHTGNGGENWVGVFHAAAIGFVFCVSVRVTGSAWWAIGCHAAAAWDWSETYFYGSTDSGLVASGHFLHHARRQCAVERRRSRPRRQRAGHDCDSAAAGLPGGGLRTQEGPQDGDFASPSSRRNRPRTTIAPARQRNCPVS